MEWSFDFGITSSAFTLQLVLRFLGILNPGRTEPAGTLALKLPTQDTPPGWSKGWSPGPFGGACGCVCRS